MTPFCFSDESNDALRCFSADSVEPDLEPDLVEDTGRKASTRNHLETNPSDATRPSRSVSFAPSPRVLEIPHIQNTPKEVVEATWYSKQDYEEIRHRFMETVHLMTAKQQEQQTNSLKQNCSTSAKAPSIMLSSWSIMQASYHCTRGLEHQTKRGHRRRHGIKASTFDAVLHEQGRQRRRRRQRTVENASLLFKNRTRIANSACSSQQWQPDMDEAIAKVYQQAGADQCRQEAYKQGLKDESEAKDYQEFNNITPSVSLDSEDSMTTYNSHNESMSTISSSSSSTLEGWIDDQSGPEGVGGPMWEDISLEGPSPSHTQLMAAAF